MLSTCSMMRTDKVRKPSDALPSKTLAAIEGVLVTKRKRMEHEAHRKSIAYRIIPAFNYEPVLIKFQWSDFVVATPIQLMSSASQLNLLNSLNGGKPNPANPGEPVKQQIAICPIQKMKLIMKKGVKLPCHTYVIISVFYRPLEDGNDTFRIQIYDSERVESTSTISTKTTCARIRRHGTGLTMRHAHSMLDSEFSCEQGSVIIKMPERNRKATLEFPNAATGDSSEDTGDSVPRVFTLPSMAQLLSVLATTKPLELPPEPQYRLTPNAPASPPRQPPP